MRGKRNFHAVYIYLPLIVAGSLLCLALTGCGKKVPYLEPQVTTSVGRPGKCAHCGKKIESVSEANLAMFDGIQYVVCDEECADGVKKWLEQLDQR